MILNTLLFVPLGVGLALAGIRWNRALLTVCALSVMVETAQHFFVSGRDGSLSDVLTNTVGGALGFAVARSAAIWLRPAPRIAAILGFGWCAIWLTIQAISSLAFAPSIPDSSYYGEFAQDVGHGPVFRGRVLRASIDNVAITDTRLSDIDSVGRRLLGGGTTVVTVVPAGLTTDIAPILQVIDGEQREIVLLAQDERDLVFGVRTRAAILRLRPPLFAMAGVFPDGVAKENSSATDTLTLSGRYDGREARLTARTGSASRDQRVLASSSLGWTLALPFQWSIEDTRTELIVSWVWMAGLMVPTGYWSAYIARSSDPRPNAKLAMLCLVGGVAILIAGLVLTPRAFGLPEVPIRDWLAVSSGLVAGAALALRMAKL